jgi:signal transduction histidine kinase
MLRSIRWRLVLSYVLLAVLAVSLVGVVALALVQQSLEQQEAAALRTNAEVIARQVSTRLFPVARLSDLDQLVQTAAFLGNARVRILDPSKTTVLADSGPREQFAEAMLIDPSTDLFFGSTRTSLKAPFIVLPAGRRIVLPPDIPFTSIRRIDSPWGSLLIFSASQSAEEQNNPSASGLAVTVAVGSPDNPYGYVELSGGPDYSSTALGTTRGAFMLGGLAAALIAVVVGLFVSRGLTAPLSGLGAAARRMSQGDLDARAPAQGKDEIGQLGVQFNQMAERLQASFNALAAERDSLRRFVADASHELRTPITALQNFTDLLQGPAASDPAAQASFLAESQKQLTRLEWLTSNLLDLSRLDAGIEALNLSNTDTAGLTRSAAALFEAPAREKNITLSVELPEKPPEVRCDSARMEIALSNLIQNAVKFTQPGGSVQVTLQATEHGIRWTVADDGPGIPAQDMPHIFERFYRGAHPSLEGSGLGLAIVHSIVLAHGGRVWAESTPGKGSRFLVELNSPDAAPPQAI